MSPFSHPALADADWPRLVQYCEGTLPEDDAKAFETWISADQQRADQVARLRAEWTALWPVAEDETWNVEGGVQQVLARIHPPHSSPGARSVRVFAPQPRGLPSLWTKVGVGAGAMALVAVFAFLWTLRAPLPSAGRAYSTAFGERKTITLSDGSRVTLAPHTVFLVSRTFGQGERKVSVTGEAFFDVAHAANVPFVVQAGSVSTRVVGTQFDVQHYADDPAVRIVVVTGKVMTHAGAHPAVSLTAGRVAYVNDSTVSIDTSVNVAALTSWKQGPFLFAATPVPDALATLGRWYGLEFRIDDTTIRQSHLSGVFSSTNRADALADLQAVLQVTLRFSESPGRLPIVTLVRRRVAPDSLRDVRQEHRDYHPVREVGR